MSKQYHSIWYRGGLYGWLYGWICKSWHWPGKQTNYPQSAPLDLVSCRLRDRCDLGHFLFRRYRTFTRVQFRDDEPVFTQPFYDRDLVLLTGGISGLISRNRRTSLIIGLLVLSHWVVDFISHPMTAMFPDDTGLSLLFDGSPIAGLGVWTTQLGVNISEYGTLFLGLVIYIFSLRKLREVKEAMNRE